MVTENLDNLSFAEKNSLNEESKIREQYLQLIESANAIDDRFIDIRRIDANGGKGFFSLLFTAKDL